MSTCEKNRSSIKFIHSKGNKNKLTSVCIKPPNVAVIMAVDIARNMQTNFSLLKAVACSVSVFAPAAIPLSLSMFTGLILLDLEILVLTTLIFLIPSIDILFLFSAFCTLPDTPLVEQHTSFGS